MKPHRRGAMGTMLGGLAGAWLAPAVRRARAARPRQLVVFAAASLREAFEALATRLEAQTPGVQVRLQLAGTQQLRLQLLHGAQADVFAAADPLAIASLADVNVTERPTVFARNRLVVVTPAANPARLTRFSDLPRAARVVLGVPEVPVGNLANRLLERAAKRLGASFTQEVLAHVASRELDVRQVLVKVMLGEADAAIVYATDARAAGDKVLAIAVPPELDQLSPIALAAVRSGAEPALARAFIALVQSPAGQSVLAHAGFLPP